jgi:hypothetical protein
MTSRRASKPNSKPPKRAGATAAPSGVIDSARVDPDRDRVMAYIRALVAAGLAQWHALDDGTVRFRLCTGETYLLKTTAMTRIA